MSAPVMASILVVLRAVSDQYEMTMKYQPSAHRSDLLQTKEGIYVIMNELLADMEKDLHQYQQDEIKAEEGRAARLAHYSNCSC